MNIQRTARIFLIGVISLCTFSCNKSNPVTNGKMLLTASENPVEIALNRIKFIVLTGGSGGYVVKSISDSTVLQVEIAVYDGYGTATFSGLKLGSAVVTIQDSASTAEVEITVTVSVMAAIPSAVTLQVQSSKHITIQGGTQPYFIDQYPDTSIVSVVELSGSALILLGKAQGSTSIIIGDNAAVTNKLLIPTTVVP